MAYLQDPPPRPSPRHPVPVRRKPSKGPSQGLPYSPASSSTGIGVSISGESVSLTCLGANLQCQKQRGKRYENQSQPLDLTAEGEAHGHYACRHSESGIRYLYLKVKGQCGVRGLQPGLLAGRGGHGHPLVGLRQADTDRPAIRAGLRKLGEGSPRSVRPPCTHTHLAPLAVCESCVELSLGLVAGVVLADLLLTLAVLLVVYRCSKNRMAGVGGRAAAGGSQGRPRGKRNGWSPRRESRPPDSIQGPRGPSLPPGKRRAAEGS